MTNQPNDTQTKSGPIYRLKFSAQTGTDRSGNPTLGYPVEIGAAFERRDSEKGLIARFHIVPMDLKEGVLFLTPVHSEPNDQNA